MSWPRDPTHAELVTTARRWLGHRMRCPVIVSEMGAGSEIPDVLGWHPGRIEPWRLYARTVMIECKVAVGDLRADRHKSVRRIPELGVGQVRFLMAPAGLAEATSYNGWLPEGWGLLIVKPHRQERWGWSVYPDLERCPEVRAEWDWRSEAQMLLSLVRRLGAAAIDNQVPVSVRAYDFEPAKGVTLAIKRESSELAD